MAIIEGIRVKNFKMLKDVAIGRVPGIPDTSPLTPMTVVIGKNGVGKSTLFDVFGFLADSLRYGVEEACSLRGGFEYICSQNCHQQIEFTIVYRDSDHGNLMTYEISIGYSHIKRTFVESELLYQYSDTSHPICFLLLKHGFGLAYDNKKEGAQDFDAFSFFEKYGSSLEKALNNIEHTNDESPELIAENAKQAFKNAEKINLLDKTKLGIASLGALKQHPKISAFREFMEGWYLSYFTPDAARTLPMSGAHPHLNSKGDNIANVVQFMEREHRDKFQNILDRIAEKIPGIGSIKTYRDPISNQLHLLFQDKGFGKPFYAPQMSDGTLKVFAYLLLLEDPNPPPFICIEEPENGLYHKLLETLAAEFRSHATGREGGSQLFITTHQPYFVDALDPDEVWILEKDKDGFSTIRRASDDELVKNMVAEGLPLGGLWYSDYLDAR